jgi:hypothetical protein
MAMPSIQDKQKEATVFDARATNDGYDVCTRVERTADGSSPPPAEIAASTSSCLGLATISPDLCGPQSSRR